MQEIKKECGKLLERMECLCLLRCGEDHFDRKLMRYIIRDYRYTLGFLEKYNRPAGEQTGHRLYLEIRKMRRAVSCRMIRSIPMETLYGFMVQNICDLEAVQEGG